jgi:homoserine dehydrogenase
MDVVRIGLLGAGTVGSGLVRVLADNAAGIEARVGARIEVGRILVRDPAAPRDAAIDRGRLCTSPDAVLDDPDCPIVVELIGGLEPARSLVLAAIERGKHVVTANKALLAAHGPELFGAARAAGVEVFFEGAVCGGIPIIRALRESLASDRITGLLGIVNGTTNYVLTEMARHGSELAPVLAEAQRLGYAEADPSADVDNHDAAQKLAILAGLGFGGVVVAAGVHREGIREVSAEDLVEAERAGYAIKSIARARRLGDRVALAVFPAWVPKSALLAHVDGVFNAVQIESEALGASMFYGRGAGQLPTGSAVAADVVELCRAIRIGAAGRRPPRADAVVAPPLALVDPGEVEDAFYLRFSVTDAPGVLGRIATRLGDHGVSIATMHQPQRAVGGAPVPIVARTHPAPAGKLRAALTEIDRLPVIAGPTRWMRVLDALTPEAPAR